MMDQKIDHASDKLRVPVKFGHMVKNTDAAYKTILFNGIVDKEYFQNDFQHFQCII